VELWLRHAARRSRRFALGRPPGRLRRHWAFERLPGYDPQAFTDLLNEPLAVPGPNVRVYGNDLSIEALSAARDNLERANLLDRAALNRGDATAFEPPKAPVSS